MKSNVLLVEDDEALANTVRRHLESKGVAVTVALTGADGFSAYHKLKPCDAVIIDVNLPDTNSVSSRKSFI